MSGYWADMNIDSGRAINFYKPGDDLPKLEERFLKRIPIEWHEYNVRHILRETRDKYLCKKK